MVYRGHFPPPPPENQCIAILHYWLKPTPLQTAGRLGLSNLRSSSKSARSFLSSSELWARGSSESMSQSESMWELKCFKLLAYEIKLFQVFQSETESIRPSATVWGRRKLAGPQSREPNENPSSASLLWLVIFLIRDFRCNLWVQTACWSMENPCNPISVFSNPQTA